MTQFFVHFENNAPIEIGNNSELIYFADKKLRYGVFEPPLFSQSKEVSRISLNDIIRIGNSVQLLPGRRETNLFDISNHATVRLKLLPIPEPYPLADFLNENLIDNSSICYVHLFYKTADSPDLMFVSSFSSRWKDLFATIGDQLSLKNLPPFQIKVGIISAPNSLPALENGITFFSASGSFVRGKRIMTIVASSDPELIITAGSEKFSTAKLPQYPKFIAHRTALLLRKSNDRTESKYLRRLLTLAIDSCVALDFLDMCTVPVDDDLNRKVRLSPEHFERGILHLGNCGTVYPGDDYLIQLLGFPVNNFIRYIVDKSNEFTLCGAFWNPLLVILLQSGEEVNHQIEWEWESTNLFPAPHPLRKVDLVYSAEFVGAGNRQVSIPFLLVENGKDFFTRERQHKDTTKLFGLMSATCIRLARELIAIGKKPEHARAFGMLNGGVKTQLVVAIPIISRVGANLYQIHTHISFPKHWELITFGTNEFDSSNCAEVCCTPEISDNNQEYLLESIIIPDTVIPMIPISFNESETEIEIDTTNLDDAGVPDFVNGNCNITSLKKIATFILLVKNSLNRIYSAPSDDTRTFIPPNERYYFSQSVKVDKQGQALPTPKGERLSETIGDGLRTPSRQTSRTGQGQLIVGESFKITKTSLNELDIYRKCSLYCPAFFPRIYNIDQSEGGAIEYTFEKMLPLFENERCSSIIFDDDPRENLISCIKFTMNCLLNLHFLHKVIGVIHCDISPVNIMYSTVDNMWKFIDYDLSMDISQCKADTSRIVGTKGFIAPESEASGIYSEASDVFSLGTVIFDVLYPDLYRQFIYVSDDLPDELLDFESLIADMFDPLNRISVLDALKKLFSLLKQILPQEHEIFQDQIVSRVYTLVSERAKERIVAAHVNEIVSKARSQQIEKEQQEIPTYPTIEPQSTIHSQI